VVAPVRSHPVRAVRAKKNPPIFDLEGFLEERLKRLELSTFCMAIGNAAALIWLICLQIQWFLGGCADSAAVCRLVVKVSSVPMVVPMR
jgi:hypothetical protein